MEWFQRVAPWPVVLCSLRKARPIVPIIVNPNLL